MENLKQKLINKEIVFASTSCFLGWTGLLKQFKNDVLDFLIFDIEHGHFGLETCEEMLRTCNLLNIPTIVRVADTEYHLMSKYIDFGADGVLVPRVETVEQALNAVEYLRFPPKGKKGCGGYSLLRGENAFENFNQNKLIFLQIESPKGVDNLDEMLRKGKNEFAGVIVGPSDLSISMGIAFQFDSPEFIAQVDQIFDICKRHCISCGIFCESDEQIRFWREKGANIIWSGTDVGLFTRGYRALSQTIRELE